jgi:hypothetical protein
MSDKLSIQNEMRAFDSKERGFYDSLGEHERRKFSTYLMMKYGGNVEGSRDLQEWYLRAHNERVNINFFDLGRHAKLQWLACTTVSPGLGNKRHYWLGNRRQETRARKFLEQLYPHLSDNELELMESINTIEQLQEHARSLGWDERDIAKQL